MMLVTILLPLVLAGPAILNDDNFQDFIDNNERVLVEFYAPWCGHCKNLAPAWEKAADRIHADDSIPVKLAAVDATEAEISAKSHDVNGYPTIKYFENGEPSDYTGGRDEHSIVNWVVAKSTPAVNMIKSKEADAFGADSHYVILGHVKKGSKKEAIFEKVCGKIRTAFEFYAPVDVKCAQVTLKKGNGRFVLRRNKFKEYDGPKELKYEGKVSKLKQFLLDNMWPVIGPQNLGSKAMFDDNQGGLLIYADMDGDYSEIVDVAKSLKEQNLRTGFLNEAESEHVTVHNKPSYLYVIRNNDGGKSPYHKYLLDHSDSARDPSHKDVSVADFVKQVQDGTWGKHFKSEEPPEEMMDENGILDLVGITFEEVAHDKNTNTLIEFYAPWCGHCKNFVPKYEKFAQKAKRIFEGKIQVAKINAADNEIEAPYGGFPTLLFYPAGKKPIKFEGDREDLDELLDFVESEAVYPKKGKDEL